MNYLTFLKTGTSVTRTLLAKEAISSFLSKCAETLLFVALCVSRSVEIKICRKSTIDYEGYEDYKKTMKEFHYEGRLYIYR